MSEIESKLGELINSDLIYSPTGEERRIKSAFWTRIQQSNFLDLNNITLAAVLRILPGEESRLKRSWEIPGFREWFTNHEEFRERVEMLAHLALDTLQEILIDKEPKTASARVNAAKLLMEVARKMPPRGVKEVYVDREIGRMGVQQLEEYIRRNSKLLPEVSSNSNTEEVSKEND